MLSLQNFAACSLDPSLTIPIYIIDIVKKFSYNNGKVFVCSVYTVERSMLPMIIKSSSTLRNDYDSLVKLSNEKNEPIYITRNGEGEMVFLSIEAYEKREAELKLLQLLLTAERNRLAGVPTHTTDSIRRELEDIYNA
jgi:prevent-host-death family protein